MFSGLVQRASHGLGVWRGKEIKIEVPLKNMDRQPNVDFILALKKDAKGSLYVEEVDIPLKYHDFLRELDNFENSTYCDIFDVVDYVSRQNFDKKTVYSYCWPHEYYQSYIRHASCTPFVFMSYGWVKIDIDYNWKKEYDKDLKETKYRVEMEYSAKRHPKRWMERTEYLSYIAKLKVEMQEEIEKEQRERKIEIRNLYIKEIRRYVYAMCYMQVLPIVKSSSLMYSNETIGWYKQDYTIAENVVISVRTNFCYGRSAHFHVNLKYKGINILPYSDIIPYFWSNMMDNVRYTKDFEPDRTNWEHAFSFVEEVSNLINTDSDRFEKEWIIDQVEKMMEGLASIVERVDEYYEKQKEAKIKATEEEEKAKNEGRTIRRIIRYRVIDDLTIKRHNIYEHETLLVIQVDKLSAALSLLDDLTAVQNIYSPVLNHIDTIIQYNVKLVPAIKLCRNDLQNYLKQLNEQLQDLQRQKVNVQNEMLAIKNEIDKRLEETDETYRQSSANNFQRQDMLRNECEKDEQYTNLQKTLSDLTGKIYAVQTEIRDREYFDRHLAEKEEYIENKLKEIKNGQ